jgi:Zn ribbon nucleic-acid-binding protein
MTAHTDAVEGLKPCPKCQGAGELRLSGDGEVEWVRCKSCGYDGKLEYSAAEAVASWNAGRSRRTPAAVPGSAEMREAAIEAAARAIVGHITPVIELEDLPKDRAALRVAHRAGSDLVNSQDDLREIATAALDAILALITPDRERIRAEVINTPETADFMAAVPLEAAHQRERWGSSHDAGKTPFDWFWLVGYLAQKAASAAVAGDDEKAKHHTISTAAALANWHAQLGGMTDMRPGIGPENGGEKPGSAFSMAASLASEERGDG